MVDQTVPHEQSEAVADAQQAYSFLDVGIVTSAPKQDTDGAHHVTVAETRTPSDKPIPVIPPAHGDYYVPPEGTPVLIAYTDENDGVVIGSPLPPTTSETVAAGERVVSHPLSQSAVRFEEDGTVRLMGDDGSDVALQPDGTLVVDGGTQGAVTNVTISDTNDYGGATSLNIIRNPDVLL
mgnify:CR=1 FL=1